MKPTAEDMYNFLKSKGWKDIRKQKNKNKFDFLNDVKYFLYLKHNNGWSEYMYCAINKEFLVVEDERWDNYFSLSSTLIVDEKLYLEVSDFGRTIQAFSL